jgi:hypothetical protein
MPRKVNKSKSNKSKSMKKTQRGGHAGTVMSSEYFGGNSGRYFPVGSDELKPCPGQFARSQGVIHADGKMAGPNLFPKHGGGKKKRTVKKNRSNRKMNKSNRKMNKSNRKMNKSNRKMNKSKKLKGGMNPKKSEEDIIYANLNLGPGSDVVPRKDNEVVYADVMPGQLPPEEPLYNMVTPPTNTNTNRMPINKGYNTRPPNNNESNFAEVPEPKSRKLRQPNNNNNNNNEEPNFVDPENLSNPTIIDLALKGNKSTLSDMYKVIKSKNERNAFKIEILRAAQQLSEKGKRDKAETLRLFMLKNLANLNTHSPPNNNQLKGRESTHSPPNNNQLKGRESTHSPPNNNQPRGRASTLSRLKGLLGKKKEKRSKKEGSGSSTA